MFTIIYVAVVSLIALGTLSTIAQVGKPRVPITPGQAIVTVIVQGLFIAAITWFYHA